VVGVTPAEWPTARLDGIARLRVLVAGLPGVALRERTIDAPFERVWAFVSDFERSVPAFDADVASLQIRSRQGDRLNIVARASWRALWLPMRFDVHLESGWCLMVSRPRLYVVAMAAEPDGDRTRFGHLEGIVGDRRYLRPLLALSRARHRRHVLHDLDGIERELGLR
jgi:hypothetical protein